jgi:hypothetical protein
MGFDFIFFPFSMQHFERPWQGTLLGVLAWISFVGTILSGIMFFFAQSMLLGFLQGVLQSVPAESAEAMPFLAGGVGGLLTGLAVFAIVPLVLVLVFNYFYAQGLLSGKKWTVILAIIGASIPFLLSVANMSLEGIVLFGIMLALPATIVKHPFYNQKVS